VVLEEKLKNYENIENDIDQAILGFGSTRPESKDNLYLNAIGMAPTSTQRRVQQSISLAQRLNEKQNELAKLRNDIKDKDLELEKRKEEAKMFQDLLSKTKQPSSYLIESLEQKEKENIALKQSLNKALNDLDYQKQVIGDLQSVGVG
jgi:predicted nuclease with TOPRIM domain